MLNDSFVNIMSIPMHYNKNGVFVKYTYLFLVYNFLVELVRLSPPSAKKANNLIFVCKARLKASDTLGYMFQVYTCKMFTSKISLRLKMY